MADLHKIAKQVSELAERVADVSDAAHGNRSRRRLGGLGGWLLLPAAGAAAYAVAKRAPALGRSAGDAVRSAMDRIEMPDLDLLDRVDEVGQRSDAKGGNAREYARQTNEAGAAVADGATRELEDHRRERAERRERVQPAG